ncbi:MAG TPA: ribonuclease P protein component [Ferruginibacter sp.]|nr:ribonuclease P protein component [Ferruginibacter sp.]
MKTAQRYFLKKEDRLKSTRVIDELFSKGKSFSSFPFRVLWRPGNKFILQAAVGVSSRNFKKAVDRNRIKRLMREAYRLQKDGLLNALRQNEKTLSLFILYNGNELPKYDQVYEKMGSILQRLTKLMNENNPADT